MPPKAQLAHIAKSGLAQSGKYRARAPYSYLASPAAEGAGRGSDSGDTYEGHVWSLVWHSSAHPAHCMVSGGLMAAVVFGSTYRRKLPQAPVSHSISHQPGAGDLHHPEPPTYVHQASK